MRGRKQQVVIVTGASSGLGAAIAAQLVQEEHIVYGTGRKWNTHSPSSGLRTLQLDVTDPASVQTAIATVIAEEQRIDVLINNAGVGIQGAAEDLSAEEAMASFDTNFFGMHRMSQAVLPNMRQANGGTIINISSIAANMGLPYRGFYSANKAAVDKYSEALNMEMAPWNIRISCVEPGDFKSNIASSRVRPNVVSEAHKPGYEACMKQLDGQMTHAPSPDRIVVKVVGIVNGSNQKFRYRVGAPLEKLAVHLRYWLPSSWFQGMLKKFSS